MLICYNKNVVSCLANEVFHNYEIRKGQFMSTRGLSYVWFGKAKEMLRCKRINPQMVGYNLLLYGICECAEDEQMTEEELYDELKNNYMVPILDFESKRNPVEQHMVEALRSAGIEENPWEFINNYISEVNSLKKAM